MAELWARAPEALDSISRMANKQKPERGRKQPWGPEALPVHTPYPMRAWLLGVTVCPRAAPPLSQPQEWRGVGFHHELSGRASATPAPSLLSSSVPLRCPLGRDRPLAAEPRGRGGCPPDRARTEKTKRAKRAETARGSQRLKGSRATGEEVMYTYTGNGSWARVRAAAMLCVASGHWHPSGSGPVLLPAFFSVILPPPVHEPSRCWGLSAIAQ